MCNACGYMASAETPGAGAEVISLDTVREKNFRIICAVIKRRFPRHKTLLDVGSSTGLFLKMARAEGLQATGLEPAERPARETQAAGYAVIQGFFPGAPELADKRYDIIIFNDSFEHIPDLRETLRGIKKHIREGGAVIVNLPSSGGIVFKTARLMYKTGIHAPFDRLWQKGFASPHIHYFNIRNLKALFEKNGFVTRYARPLRYYTLKGLWGRISCKSPFFISLIAWLGMFLLYPLSALRSDCVMACFSAPENEGGSL